MAGSVATRRSLLIAGIAVLAVSLVAGLAYSWHQANLRRAAALEAQLDVLQAQHEDLLRQLRQPPPPAPPRIYYNFPDWTHDDITPSGHPRRDDSSRGPEYHRAPRSP
jgi:hypothetical protein